MIEASNKRLPQAKKGSRLEVPSPEDHQEGLRHYLRQRSKSNSDAFKWSIKKDRVPPGVRPDDRNALFDLMEGQNW